jgi:hypothetical protein
MDEFFRFISKSERERVRLKREARAIYDSVFPPADPVSEEQDSGPHLRGSVAPMPNAARGLSRDQDHRSAL